MILNEISKGIPHIEDLPLAEFFKVINSLHEHELTEKLDGAQILFGIDENGFYTSRESKGGVRIYNESEYDIRFPTTYMRAAHKLLEQVLPQMLSAGLRQGDQVEAEVLFDVLPNVVPYSEDRNYLIFLRTTEGAINIDHLKQKLDGQSLLVDLVEPYTLDGRNINLREQTREWSISRVPQVSVNVASVQKLIAGDVVRLNDYLRKSSGIEKFSNRIIESIPLNKRPDWCEPKDWKDVKESIRVKKAEITQMTEVLKSHIKSILVDHIVSSQQSHFGPTIQDGGWIEGVVLRHPQTKKMVKIVDKNHFGFVREAAWKKRNMLTENAKSTEGDLSFVGNLRVGLATSLGHPSLGTMQAKNYLRKAGDDTRSRLESLSEGVDFESVKEYWLGLLETAQVKFDMELKKYAKETDHLNEGLGSLLSNAVTTRTLETFATVFQNILHLKESTLSARKTVDLLEALVGKQLKEIE